MYVIWYNVDRRFVGTFVMPDDWHTAHAAMVKAALTSALKVDAVSALLIHNAPVGSINECREFFIWGIANCLQSKLEMVGITMDKAITIRSRGGFNFVSRERTRGPAPGRTDHTFNARRFSR